MERGAAQHRNPPRSMRSGASDSCSVTARHSLSLTKSLPTRPWRPCSSSSTRMSGSTLKRWVCWSKASWRAGRVVDHMSRGASRQRAGAGSMVSRHMAVALIALACTMIPARTARGQDASLAGSLYLYHNRPFGADAPPPRTEVYAAIVSAQLELTRWTLFAQLRARDQPLRAFYPGTIWIQQAWAAYDVVPRDDGPLLVLRAGKIDQALGLVWDGSFSGNIQYFDALKRNPSFGAEAAGSVGLGGAVVHYVLQYMLDSDRVSGAIPGRDFATLDGFRTRDDIFTRATIGTNAERRVGAALGVSAASRGVAERSGLEEEVFRVPHVGADLELRGGPVVAYVEWLFRDSGELPDRLRASIPGSEATYWLAGARYSQRGLYLRYNYSRARYDDVDREDWIHQPGVGYDLNRHVHALAEINIWRFREGQTEDVFARSVNVVLVLHL